MQPELNEISNKPSLTFSTQNSHHDSQYGCNHSEQRLPSQLFAGEGTSDTKQLLRDNGRAPNESLEHHLRRLSPPTHPQARSPVNRIAEHEKASIKLPKRRNEGPAFTVVQKGKRSASDHIALGDFPNGLTHRAQYNLR